MTGKLYNGFKWPVDEDEEPINNMDNTSIVKLPENPATKGYKYGINPKTGILWFNQLINNNLEP